MGTSLDAIYLVLKSLISTEPWQRDPNVVPLPWRESVFEDTMRRAAVDGSANEHPPLKLGIYSINNLVNPHPPVARGLRLVVDALKNAGHKVHHLRHRISQVEQVTKILSFHRLSTGCRPINRLPNVFM